MPPKKKSSTRKQASITRSSAVEYLTFVAAQGQGGVEVVYADEDIWLTQKMLGVLYNVKTHTINYHLKAVDSKTSIRDALLDKWRSFRHFAPPLHRGTRSVERPAPCPLRPAKVIPFSA